MTSLRVISSKMLIPKMMVNRPPIAIKSAIILAVIKAVIKLEMQKSDSMIQL